MSVRPVELPELRAEIREQVARPSIARPLLDLLKIPDGDGSTAFVKDLQKIISELDLFHVAEPMTDLICAAAETLEVFAPQAEDMPAPMGMVIFDGQPAAKLISYTDGCTAPLLGIIWGSSDSRPDMTVIPIAEAHDHGSSEARPVVQLWMTTLVPLGEDLGFEHGHPELRDGDVLAQLLTTWLLMRQPLADSAEVQVDRAARKRLRRINQEPAPVRVIELRRPKTAPDSSAEPSREYHHRWITRGHWRQHWYPKRQVHRPVWIAPHIKGPEGAPLIGGEKVYALKR